MWDGRLVPMLRTLAVVASLTLNLSGCLKPLAALVGDGGGGGAPDSGTELVDAGLCADDSQCGNGYYCDFTLTSCPWDGGSLVDPRFSVVNVGSCLQDCSGACPTTCHVGEDCDPSQLCLRWISMNGENVGFPCTAEQPCSDGVCDDLPCPGPPYDCPAECTVVSAPHSCTTGCVCPGNTCEGVPAPTPEIACDPMRLNFGTVAAGIPSTLPVICTNTGAVTWTLGALASDAMVFTATIDPNSSATIAPGTSLVIDVTYNPAQTEWDTGTLSIDTATGATLTTIALAGDALGVPPCYFSLTPETIDFGQVACGAAVSANFTIADIGPGNCLIEGLTTTCAGWTIGVTSQRLSAPGGPDPSSLIIEIDDFCSQPDAGSCNFQLSVSGTFVTLPISGSCCVDGGASAGDGG
jgi:hypothetical protein